MPSGLISRKTAVSNRSTTVAPKHPEEGNLYKDHPVIKTTPRTKRHAIQQAADTSITMTPYVLQGMYYFLRHKILWQTMAWPMFFTAVFVVVCFCVLLPLAFVPQAIMLSAVMTPFLGWILALLIALLEMFLLILLFSAIVLLPITDKLFDHVLRLRGHGGLVDEDNHSACCGCCSTISILSFGLGIITLPLNLIPMAGTVLWVAINGRCYAWDKHSHYFFELKGWRFRQQRQYTRNLWYAYHSFGAQAMGLELVPFASILFVFTNTVGAALWAADMEDKLQKEIQDTEQPHASSEQPTTIVAVEVVTDQQPGQEMVYPTEETPLGPK